ncbi:hypothetical protein DDE74_32520 [Streptomyces lydicus]|uniref:Uncharacterized protein n=1 Tax=Streptomyces lydicus TaxID=47763 RepID=A0A3S9YJ58_9ACTN|nr:MarR family transcriptional regulator [Streptomyces lydicus]AZS75021.1 hypothetical protein DDE74_32520 [Streptomyces lydicus]
MADLPGTARNWHSSRPPTEPSAGRSPPAPVQRTIEHLGPDPDATAAFVTDLTTALVETGLPRTAARVMACLFASETGSRTAIEMAQHLQVSAGTISHAVRLLERQDLIRRELQCAWYAWRVRVLLMGSSRGSSVVPSGP